MKKKIIIASLMLMSIFAYAQEITNDLSKRIFLGGSVGYDEVKTKNRSFSINVTPTIGYFFTDDIAGGLKLGYTYDRKKNKVDNHFFSTTPFIRKFWRMEGRFMPFLELNAHFNWLLKDRETFVRYKEKNGRLTWGVALEPGFGYRLSDKIMLHTTIGRFEYTNNGKNNDSYRFGLDLTNISLGVAFFL